MAIVEEASGTLTVTGGTDQDLAAASAVDGIYQLFIDVNDMVILDKLEVAAWEMVISGGTTREIDRWYLSHAQGSRKVWVSPAMVFLHGWKFTLKASVGSISVPWSIRKIT
jgi:hypothetical protein